MKAIETGAIIDDKGFLKIDTPLQVVNKRVKIIILLPEEEEEEIDDAVWLKGLSVNPAFDFLHDEDENVYSVNDGEPFFEGFR